MEKILGVIAGSLGVTVLLFLLVPLYAIIYGAGAWILGLFFADLISETVMTLFNTDVDFREIGFFNIGMTLGFLGGYIRTHNTNNSK